ncbi:MAG TPA: VOC family protein [Mucilaginibacter sp.]|jgi:catechol 2,3-dioxygenase-like lactoylglutathione lyase family enzyme
MEFRIARHTKDLNQILDFYGGILGLKILGEFKNHDSYDGIFLGIPGADWHLEFTVSDAMPDHHPDDDDLLVFYINSASEFNHIKEKFLTNNVKQADPKNPYWKSNGITFQDPDGYRIVISLERIS